MTNATERIDLSQGLPRETWTRLDAYLAGRLDGPSVSAWATAVLSRPEAVEPALLAETIMALANLDHADERFDTANEDLEFYRDCLLGKRAYQPAVVVEKRVR